MSGPSGHSSASSSAAGSSSSGPPVSVQEFSIRVPKNLKKKHHVMRFNATLNVDFTQWRAVKMERENNLKEFKGFEEDMPKFGAGSEFNRDLREEARRKRYGIIAKKYRPEAQPWILKAGGKKDGKKFRGIREGGVGENAAFYVFTHAPDGAIEAYPLHEWYNFQPIQRYKALSAEEAEQEFSKRKKVMNYFSLMLRKRMKGDDDTVEDPEEAKAKKGGTGKAKDLKISDMDEWIDSDELSSSDDDDEGKSKEKDSDEETDKKAKNKKKALAESKKKKRDVDEEALEESDDGDEEGRELDYISDSSESESEPEGKANKELKSVAEEDALRKLLTSDEDSEDEDKKSEEEDSKKEDDKNAKSKEKEKEAKDKESKDSKKKKKNKKKKKSENDKKDSSSGSSSDSSDSEGENSNSKQKKKHKKDKEGFASNLSSANNSRSASPSMNQLEGNKRKMAGSNMPTADLTGSDNSNSPMSTPAKKTKMDSALALPPTFTGLVSSNSKDDYGITEEAVRRYLMRKPMTTTELLTKFKNKKTGVSSEKLVETMTAILKKINPVKQTIQGKMYLSIKVPK
ncbi:general transcription factor IIF subunit 1 [Malaya genurostris]|uniref:general transcription factor IIF subunit 1 n=1 Tax=Malaya genurostris TaxID=325434 RepID=UPI0026F3A8B1|nr:general transcription factor IIF subunit 1 [Malaya genurostris]